jgi:hypothetical protein
VSALDPPDVLARFKRDNPHYADPVDALGLPGDGPVLVASARGGDVRLLVSIRSEARTSTLQQYIADNVPTLEHDSRITIDGSHREIVTLRGGAAWRIRWSVVGSHGKAGIVQYTFLRNSASYLFTYSTLKPYERYSGVFETSARSIRFARAPS